MSCWTLGLLASWTAPLAAAPPAASPATTADGGSAGFWEILFSGGPIGIAIMCVLIGMSLTAGYLVFEHLLSLRRELLLPEGLSEQVRQAVLAGRLPEAERLCQARPSLLAFVLQQGLAEAEGDWVELEKALEDALAEQSARLLRKLEFLSVLANLAPMVGLLGTVVGMVMAFKQVADTRGTAGAADLAEGIYTALVTTVAGLLVAIPALAAFALFRNRVDQFLAEAAYAALHVFRPLKGKRRRRQPPLPPPAPGEGPR